MLILTNENTPFNLDAVPDEIDDLRYCIWDCSDPTDMDFYFVPLIFLESFYAPAIVLNIGGFQTQMPLDWSILVCDETYSDLEVIPLTSLNDRGFNTVTFNPLKQLLPSPKEVTITNVYAEVKWFFPKLKQGHVLVMPLEDGPNPQCAMFVKESNKIPDQISMGEIVG